MGQYHLDDHCTIHVNQKQRRFWGGSFNVLIEPMMLIWLMVLINLDVHTKVMNEFEFLLNQYGHI